MKRIIHGQQDQHNEWQTKPLKKLQDDEKNHSKVLSSIK